MIRVRAIVGICMITMILLGLWYLICKKRGKQFAPKIYNSNVTLCVFVFLRVLTLLTIVRSATIGNYGNILVCVLTLFLLSMPSILEKTLKIQLPTTMEIIILVFVFAAEILGEINHYYTLVNGWDTALHTLNGFLCAAVGFALVDMLNRNRRIKFILSPGYLALTAFCFSMTVGVLWEFFEFAGDQFFMQDMQKDYLITSFSSVKLGGMYGEDMICLQDIKDTAITTADGLVIHVNGYLDIGIIDTMKDLFVNFIGAVIFSTIGYIYVKQRGKGKFAAQFIPQVNMKGGDDNASNGLGDY